MRGEVFGSDKTSITVPTPLPNVPSDLSGGVQNKRRGNLVRTCSRLKMGMPQDLLGVISFLT
ncbi:MAG: hypothetical protein U5L95_01340 [Candidatus Saccharibacteria bacterium]|nr:hypothetical protein [Candidatus Saccharibacteria bacterium]